MAAADRRPPPYAPGRSMSFRTWGRWYTRGWSS
jgi:hypothetical protein